MYVNPLRSTLAYEHADLEPYVAAGAAWMDENEPDWASRIDTGMLDMGLPNWCILGQTRGYGETVGEFGWGESDDGEAFKLGFYIPSYAWYNGQLTPVAYDSGYEILTELWKVEIAKRLIVS